MQTRLRFEGGRELANALAGFRTRVSRKIVLGALTEAAEPMRTAMSRLAPVEPGKPDLRDMMRVRPSRVSGTVAVAVGPTKAGFYGIFQEFGTSRHAAQPFARPAFDGTVGQSLGILRSAMWAAILKRRGIARSASSGLL